MVELRLSTYFLVPVSSINTVINLPYFAWDNSGAEEPENIVYRTMGEMQTLNTRYIDPDAIVDIEPCRTYTDGYNYTLDIIGDIFGVADFPRNVDGNIEYVVFPQTMHPSVYKDFINELRVTSGYTTYSDALNFDWDSIDVFLNAPAL